MKKTNNITGTGTVRKVGEYKIQNDFNDHLWPDNKYDIFHKDDERFYLVALLIAVVILAVVLVVAYSSKIADLNNKIEELQKVDAATIEYVEEKETTNFHISKHETELNNSHCDGYKRLPLPEVTDGSFKSWMDYRMITDIFSPQYALQQEARTDGTGLRMIGDRFMVAMGTAYAKEIGQELEIEFESGFIKCIVGDFKANQHTDSRNMYTLHDGSIVEFIIDREVMDPNILAGGDISALGLSGGVVEIRRMP